MAFKVTVNISNSYDYTALIKPSFPFRQEVS